MPLWDFPLALQYTHTLYLRNCYETSMLCGNYDVKLSLVLLKVRSWCSRWKRHLSPNWISGVDWCHPPRSLTYLWERVSGGATCQGEHTPGDNNQQSRQPCLSPSMTAHPGSLLSKTEPWADMGPDLSWESNWVCHAQFNGISSSPISRMRYFK